MERLYTLDIRGIINGDIPEPGDLKAELLEAVYAVLEEHKIEGAPNAQINLVNRLEAVPDPG